MSVASDSWDIIRALVLSTVFFIFFNLLLSVLLLSNTSIESTDISEVLRDIGGPKYLFIVLITILTLHLMYVLYSRHVSHLSLSHFEIPGSLQDSVIGGALAVVLFSGIVLLMMITGVVRFETGQTNLSILIALALSIQAAYSEELILRGILYRRLYHTSGHTVALSVTSVIFGGLHFINPGATLIGTLNIMLTAGVILGASYAITGRLWFPIFFHLLWNFVQGGIYGLPISGIETSGLLRATTEGSELLTGGTFGPEASIFTTVVLLPITLLSLWIMYRQPDWLPSFRYLEHEDPWNEK